MWVTSLNSQRIYINHNTVAQSTMNHNVTLLKTNTNRNTPIPKLESQCYIHKDQHKSQYHVTKHRGSQCYSIKGQHKSQYPNYKTWRCYIHRVQQKSQYHVTNYHGSQCNSIKDQHKSQYLVYRTRVTTLRSQRPTQVTNYITMLPYERPTQVAVICPQNEK